MTDEFAFGLALILIMFARHLFYKMSLLDRCTGINILPGNYITGPRYELGLLYP